MILWLVLFVVGMWLAMHKPLWGDEIYGQKITIEGNSWDKILTGRLSNEGNNFPLYYTLQKIIMSVIKFHIPVEHGKDYLFAYPQGQIILRLLPDALMTSSIVFLVRFFWIREGIMVGLMALLSALSSGMVWWYWVEARPYPLWFLLTMLQALFLIEILSESGSAGKAKNHLIICHWFLAASAILGFIQVIIVQVILFLSGKRDLRYHFLGGILPVCTALLFLSGHSNNSLFIGINPVDIIRLNFSYEQSALLFFYLMAFLCRQVWVCKNNGHDQRSWKGLVHLPNFFIGFCLSIMILVYILWHNPGGHNGNPIYGRHFLFLSALSVVLVPAMFSDLWSRSTGPFWRGVFSIFFIVLFFSQFIEGFTNAWCQGFYF